jgi:archaetidylinositol phosphate synthase
MGDLLDHVLDRYADVLVVAGLTVGVGRYALWFAAVTGVLLMSYLGTQIQAVGLGRAYGGALGRADRLALVGLVAGVSAFARPTVAGPRRWDGCWSCSRWSATSPPASGSGWPGGI